MTTSSEWSASEVPDLDGRTIVITGANSGIGLEAATVMARRRASVVMACRNEEKGTIAANQLRKLFPDALVVVMELDIASLKSIQSFASEFSNRFGQLDVLVNNAGIMAVPYGSTVDGFERQIGTNHLGHFALTGLLLERLVATPASRVVTVSSIAHIEADLDFDNFQYEGGDGYEPMKAYRRSKLCNLLFAYELDRRLRASGHDVASLAVHPGVSVTNLFNHMGWWARLFRPIAGLVLQGAEAGALPTLRAATDPYALGGQYYGPTKRKETSGPPDVTTSSPLSHDEAVASQLWQLSERLTGVTYLP